jgi:hypothetical protein
LLLRSFRNVRLSTAGTSPELDYEKKLAQKLVYQNMILRREADASGDVQISSLLENLEPILLDIANLPDKARPSDVRTIKDRVERKNIVALLQVNSTALSSRAGLDVCSEQERSDCQSRGSESLSRKSTVASLLFCVQLEKQ